MFSERAAKGRINLNAFVRLIATNPSNGSGLYLVRFDHPGSDADLVIQDARRRLTLTTTLMQHAIDYTLQGLEVTGRLLMMIARGRLVIETLRWCRALECFLTARRPEASTRRSVVPDDFKVVCG